MDKIYIELEKRIAQLDFNEIYPEFHCFDFALYNKTSVLIKGKEIPFDERFIGNTTIRFDNRQIAIWNMDYPVEDLDIFTSKIVHEMFHAFQMENKETRFPDESSGLFYDYSAKNISDKYQETQLLIKAYQNKDSGSMDEFIARRNQRSNAFYKNTHYEGGIESVEGTARFVELKALDQLDSSKADRQIIEMLAGLQNIENYGMVRKVSYDIGALFMLTSEILGIDIDYTIKGNTLHIVYSHHHNNTIFLENEPILPEAKTLSEQIINTNAQVLEKFFSEETNCLGQGKLIGFDPMNTIRYGNRLLFKHFARFEIDGSQRNIFGSSVGILTEDRSQYTIYIAKQ